MSTSFAVKYYDAIEIYFCHVYDTTFIDSRKLAIL